MGKENLGYWDYLKAAFGWKVRLPVLGWMPLNKLALAGFAILGFGHPGFWLLGLAWEAAYLLYLPGNPRFQKLVQGIQLSQSSREWGNKEQDLLAVLDAPAQRRYQQLSERCWKIVTPARQGSVTATVEELKAGDLRTLLWIFLNLLVSQQKIRLILNAAPRENLEREIESIRKNMEKEAENSPVWRSLKGVLDIQQRRFDNLEKYHESLRVTESELYRIEKQLNLIEEEMAVSKDPVTLSARLDGVVKSLEGTTQWMTDNAQFFTALDEEPMLPAGTILPGQNQGAVKGKGNGGKVAE